MIDLWAIGLWVILVRAAYLMGKEARQRELRAAEWAAVAAARPVGPRGEHAAFLRAMGVRTAD